MDTVGVGVIGTGFGRAVHLPSFLGVEHATVVGVASRDPARARRVAEEFALPRAFDSWRDLVECSEIAVVSVATPPVTHEEITRAACAAGKSVLCEKPLALDAVQAQRMLQTARAASVVHLVAFEFRELPAFRFARQLLQRGVLGRLRHVDVSWILQAWADPARPWSWRSDLSQGGGTLGALGVHTLDYLEWLLGPVRRLAARLTTRVDRRPDASGAWRTVDTEDCCHLLFELRNGTPGTVSISAVANVGRGHWIRCDGEERALIVGSDNLGDYGKGFAVWMGTGGPARMRRLRIPRELRFEREFEDGRIAPFSRLARRLVEAVREGRTDVRPSFEDGVRAQILLDLVRQADRDRRWVDVPDPTTTSEERP